MNAETITDEEIKGLIDKWGIKKSDTRPDTICPTKNIYARTAVAEWKALIPLLKEVKPRILAILDGRKAQAEADARTARERVDAIPGLADIRKAQDALYAYNRAFEAAFASEDACIIQARLVKPATDIGALLARYPAAAAYLDAERKADRSTSHAAGKKAMQAIAENPSCYAEAIAQMNATIKKDVDRAMYLD